MHDERCPRRRAGGAPVYSVERPHLQGIRDRPSHERDLAKLRRRHVNDRTSWLLHPVDEDVASPQRPQNSRTGTR